MIKDSPRYDECYKELVDAVSEYSKTLSKGEREEEGTLLSKMLEANGAAYLYVYGEKTTTHPIQECLNHG